MKKTVAYKKCIFISLLLLISLHCSIYAQTAAQLIEKGNAAYKAGSFIIAQNFYEQALANDATHQFPEARFNLGNSFFQQKKFLEALQQFNQLTSAPFSVSLKAAAWYNTGNIYLEQKKYADAVTAFKNTLRLNPRDEDARYNFTIATSLLTAQQTPAGKKEQQKPKESFQPPPQANLSPEELRRLLEELNTSENETLQRRPKKLQQKKKNEKDW